MDLDKKIGKIVSKEFQIGFKFQKSYPFDLGLDTTFENRIRMTSDWIQIENFGSVSSGCGYNFSKMYPYWCLIYIGCGGKVRFEFG